MFVEKRIEPRTPLTLRLSVGAGVDALTRDISPSGLYFEFDGHCDFGGPLVFEMDLPESSMKFTAEGAIVRMEQRGGVTGVAVRLIAGRLQSTR